MGTPAVLEPKQVVAKIFNNDLDYLEFNLAFAYVDPRFSLHVKRGQARLKSSASKRATRQQPIARHGTLKEICVLLVAHENDYEQVEQTIESGFLVGSNHSLAEHHAWVLGIIAADYEICQQLIANAAVLPLVKLLSNPSEKELAKTSAWACSNLARRFETPVKPFVDAGIIPVLIKGLSQPASPAPFREDILVEVAWLLSFLTALEEAYLKLMMENGLVDLLLPYFSTNTDPDFACIR
ncbi:Importin subunit alpha-9 [Phytophthora citrophthora]|uniref:Importin subunit alpha-9 n=1 Tax=Phytophthora citrophthora TaxID=4793 RepID=A0AAD9FZ29_9STRA|nr:Importin subunit alpha-9 [Phytophthora citrophthora]